MTEKLVLPSGDLIRLIILLIFFVVTVGFCDRSLPDLDIFHDLRGEVGADAWLNSWLRFSAQMRGYSWIL